MHNRPQHRGQGMLLPPLHMLQHPACLQPLVQHLTSGAASSWMITSLSLDIGQPGYARKARFTSDQRVSLPIEIPAVGKVCTSWHDQQHAACCPRACQQAGCIQQMHLSSKSPGLKSCHQRLNAIHCCKCDQTCLSSHACEGRVARQDLACHSASGHQRFCSLG